MTPPPAIPASGALASYQAHKDAVDDAVQRVLGSGWYILGSEVESFEKEFAAYLGAQEVIGTGSGTEALHLALRVLGIGHGDKVVTVSHTAVATVAAIELAGATPVLVDIDPVTFCLNEAALESVIQQEKSTGAQVKAIIPVHLYGHPADLPGILELAARYDLRIIEDCAQAHGTILQGRRVGTWGTMAAFSFYPTKNLGAFGDGGALVTNDPSLAEKARSLRQYGWRSRYVSDEPGLNTRLDEIQAAILRAKLPFLDRDNARRRELASEYDQLLAHTGFVLPKWPVGGEHVFHQYVIRSARRDELQAFLRQLGIPALIHYPVPVHLQPAYRGRLKDYGLRETERAANEVLSLPMYPELTTGQAETVASAIRRFKNH